MQNLFSKQSESQTPDSVSNERKYVFSFSTPLVASKYKETVSIQVDEDETEEEIDSRVEKIFTDWLHQNASGGFERVL